jgi:hypothetical protein
MKTILAAVLLIALMACASSEVPPGVPTTVYGIASDSNGDPVGPGKTVDVYVNGQLYQSVETFAGEQSDSVYVLTFGEGDVADGDTLTFKIGGKAAGGSMTFGSLDDVDSLNLRAEASSGDDDDDGGGSHRSGTNGGSTGTVGATVGGIGLPAPQTNPPSGPGQPGTTEEGDTGQSATDDGANGGQQKGSGEAGTWPTGAAVGGEDNTWMLGLGVLAVVVVTFLFVRKGSGKGRFSIWG